MDVRLINNYICDNLLNKFPNSSARNINRKCILSFFIVVFVILFFIGNQTTFSYMLIFMNVIYTTTMIFKVILFVYGRFGDRGLVGEEEIFSSSENRKLPRYTIIVPLLKEEAILQHLIKSLINIDYPTDRLDIKLVLESDDYVTRIVLKKMALPKYFEIIVTPFSCPQTKPKACNYAMLFAKGEFVTIFDAEDRPNALQLKEVVKVFRRLPYKYGCIQAQLNYYNYADNLLTRFFSIEYACLFDYMLHGLSKLGMPIPLGGTSCHFRTSILKHLGCWDAYNMTEDADIGMRMYGMGYKVFVLHSDTLEEAPIGIKAWIKQRSRWIKGYIQTYCTNIKQIGNMYKFCGFRGVVAFNLFICAPVLIFVFGFILWIISFLFLFSDFSISIPLFYTCIFNFCMSYIIHVIFAYLASKDRGLSMSITVLLSFPFYWFLHSIAGIRAVKDFFMRPNHWDKTEHGVSFK